MKLRLTIVVLLCLLGVRFSMYFRELPHYQSGEVFNMVSVLQEEPENSNKGQTFSIKDHFNQLIFVSTASFPELRNGQVLQISGTIQTKQLPDKRTLYSLHYPRITVLAQDQNVVFAAARMIKEQTKYVYDQTLPTTSANLLMGIVFGSKEHFSDDFLAALQATGVMHVIAASGMNVTFVAAALLSVLGTFLKRQIALLMSMVGIIFYVFLVGFQASILRASIMAVIVFGASIVGRQNYAGFAVLLTAYSMLIYQPGYLFDVGFQLSFLATLGIMYLKPLIPIVENVYTEAFTTTFAAEVSTLPVLLSVFGKLGIFSLLVNAITLWTIPFLMTVGSLAAIVGVIAFPLAQLLLFMALPFLLYFETIVSILGRIGGVIHVSAIQWPFFAAYYMFLAALVIKKQPSVDLSIHEKVFAKDRD